MPQIKFSQRTRQTPDRSRIATPPPQSGSARACWSRGDSARKTFYAAPESGRLGPTPLLWANISSAVAKGEGLLPWADAAVGLGRRAPITSLGIRHVGQREEPTSSGARLKVRPASRLAPPPLRSSGCPGCGWSGSGPGSATSASLPGGGRMLPTPAAGQVWHASPSCLKATRLRVRLTYSTG